ncbi:MAG: site-2 protease family protein [Elusimicrobia bacterium]|nr:site-2 protease family protein [Elusimicrobiota bacterium]
MILSILSVLLTFGLVIFLHEGGHFAVCKWLGVRVERFAFGFGPELLGFTSHGTRFSICAIPLGGFVKPAGESLEDHTGHPDEYFSRTPWERLAIVAAGPAMNYVLAFFMFSGVAFFQGLPEASSAAVIGETVEAFPAAAAGLKAGDRVLKVDGTPVAEWKEMAEYVHSHAGKGIQFTYAREGAVAEVTVTPQLDSASGHGLIGIRPEMTRRSVGFFESAKLGVNQCWYWTAYTVKTLAEKIYKREKPDLAGPVGIVQMVSRAAHSGFEDLVFLIGLISVAIGFFNVLPIPLLDGGHGVLYIWEGISGRKLTVKIVAAANSVGLAFLMSLLVFATYNDISRIRDGRKAAREAAEKAAVQQAPKK